MSASRPIPGLPRAVWLIAGVAVLGLLSLSPAYGFHRDELYFIVAGRHPALGYVDQPPITPLLSAAMVQLIGLSPTAVRILPAIATGVVILLTGLMARDLGADRRAQGLAALAVGLSGYLAVGHIGATATYDLLAWAVVLWLVVRLLGGADPRLWLAVGIVAGIALENKHIMLFLGAGLAAGLVLGRRWDVIRSIWAWAALGIAVLLWLPNLAWQVANGFPQLEMAAAIAGDAADQRARFPLELMLIAGPLLFPVALAGGWWLLRHRDATPWRAAGWASVVILALVFIAGGKSYYAAGVLPLLFAAGSIPLDAWLSRGRPRLRAAVVAVVAATSGLVAIVLVLPIVPVERLAATPIPDVYSESAEQVGWPELVSTVEAVVAGLPPEDRGSAVIITGNYGEASALILMGGDLPPVYSGHNAYWDWGAPPDGGAPVVVVGWSDASAAARGFAGCSIAARVDNGLDIENQEQGLPVIVCDRTHQPWSTAWPHFRHLD